VKVYDRAGIQLWHGDALATLREMPDQAANMCVTSPPYWGLRDYGTAAWDGGSYECESCGIVKPIGELTAGCPNCGQTMTPYECDHAGEPFRTRANVNGNTGTGTDGKNAEGRQFYRDVCGRCGARRIDRQLGLEATPDEYVAAMVAVFREVRRVLRDDGTLWLNIGDTYSSGGRGEYDAKVSSTGIDHRTPGPRPNAGLPDKNLVGIPWRLAFALQADGWYLRSDIIWSKPNPMPESVTDRPTKAHEYLFLLSKRERYYYDADAIREAHAEPWRGQGERDTPNKVDTSEVAGWALKTGKREYNPNGRNKRDVWTIATAPYPDAHFATFPPDLVRPCILAGSPDGGVVLEPFAGSGTTLQVAKELGRQAIGIELSGEYLPMIAERLDRVAIPMPLFAPAPILAEQGAFI
jgi:DNA modification methylase